MTNFRFSVRHAGFPDFDFAFTVSSEPSHVQHSHSFPDPRTLANLAHGISKKASTISDGFDLISFASKTSRSPEDVIVSAIEIEGTPFSLKKFSVNLDDTAMDVMAESYSQASLLAVAKRQFEGMPFERLLTDPLTMVREFDAFKNAANAQSYKEPILFERDLYDWHIMEGAEHDLSEIQQQPYRYTLMEGAYGFIETFTKNGSELSFGVEVDHGVVVSRGYTPASDNVIVETRLSRDMAQVNISTELTQKSYNVTSDEIALNSDGNLTQDADEAPALTI